MCVFSPVSVGSLDDSRCPVLTGALGEVRAARQLRERDLAMQSSESELSHSVSIVLTNESQQLTLGHSL